jgi:hypothetical protein
MDRDITIDRAIRFRQEVFAVLSKTNNVGFFKRSLGVVITAGALGLGLFMGSAGPGRAQDKGATPPPAATAPTGPQAQNQQEFDDASAAQNEKDDTKRLADLDKWKKDFPTTPLVDARHAYYLTTYYNLKMYRQAFDEAQEILKDHPADNLSPTAYADALQSVMQIKPTPSAADLDTGEKNALAVLDNAAIFAAASKPAGMTDAQWAQTKGALQNYSEKILMAIYLARKDDKREADDLTRLINRDPTLAAASYQLGQAMQRIIRASNKLEDQPQMFWQFARAISVTGPNALPAAAKTQATTYLGKAYATYHGSAEGLDNLMTQASKSPFPPPGFSIKSTVDIAKEQAEADAAEQAKDPLIYLWVHQVKELLLMDPSVWAQVMGTEIPGPDPNDKSDKPAPRFFNATIISMTPATKPKEIIVGIEKANVADAKLTFKTALPGKMDPGEKIQFKGEAKEFSKEPFMITFELDDVKEDMNGTWTGKNAPAPKQAPKAAPKAAPKQQ